MKINTNNTPEVSPSQNESASQQVVYNDDATLNPSVEDKYQDPNAIPVFIVDEKTPIVVLFGPGKCGKTMTQIRLARYLRKQGYKVEPIRDFRPSNDDSYTKNCDNYPQFLNSDDAAPGTDALAFMLLGVWDSRGNKICQILEAPGEHYHDPEDPNANFPAYINNLIASSTKKIWVVTLEPNWVPRANCQPYNRNDYVSKIEILSRSLRRGRDKVLFLYNKIDATNLEQRQGEVNYTQMIKDVKNHFPNVFTPFLNTHPIKKWWRKYNCDLLPFSTGTYSQYKAGTETRVTYTMGSDVYPRNLWKKIRELIS